MYHDAPGDLSLVLGAKHLNVIIIFVYIKIKFLMDTIIFCNCVTTLILEHMKVKIVYV